MRACFEFRFYTFDESSPPSSTPILTTWRAPSCLLLVGAPGDTHPPAAEGRWAVSCPRLRPESRRGAWLQLEVEYADQTEITNIEAEIAADNSFIDTLGKHIDASTVRGAAGRMSVTLRWDGRE